jgi:ribosomal protein S6--L-glutamate ligase
MRAAIISQGSVSSKWTAEAMKKYFDSVDIINLKHIEISFTGKKQEILYKGEHIKDYDAIYAKGSFRFANLLSALTSMLAKDTYLPICESAFTIAHDKLLTQLKLNAANIPMPKTFLTSTVIAAKEILKKMNYPVIMKFPKGTQGKGVMFADSRASAMSILDALTALKQPVIIQEYIETDGTDIRAFVIGNKVVAAYKRISLDDDKRSNIHQGGKGESIVLDAKTKKIALSAARIIKADICGVDILESSKGPVVLEVNLSPGLQGVTKYSKVDIADKIAKFIFEEAQKQKEIGTKQKSKSLMVDFGIEDSAKKDDWNELITTMDFRGERMLLPNAITKKINFNDTEEVVFKFKKGKLIIEKF